MTRKPADQQAVRIGMNEKQDVNRRPANSRSRVQTFATNYGKKEAYTPGHPRGERQEFGSMDMVHKAAGTVGRGPTKTPKASE